MKDLFISVDIEADGPIPGEYSMLSFGAVAFDKESIKDTFYGKLRPLPGAKQHSDTMEWWAKHPEAWKETTEDAEDPCQVMVRFMSWLSDFTNEGMRPVLVGYPVAYDAMFLTWYYWKFLERRPPWGHQGLDIKTAAWIRLGYNYGLTVKASFPKYWFKGAQRPMAHCALDDAKSQAVLLRNILKDDAPPPKNAEGFLTLLDRLAPEANVKVLKQMGQPFPAIANIVAHSVFVNDIRDPNVAVLRAYLKVLRENGFYEFKS